MKLLKSYYEILKHTEAYQKWLGATSYYKGRKNEALFQEVKTYCMLIGHTKSGGSLIGSLLDAHPNIIFSDEEDALQYVPLGFNKDQIFHLIMSRSQKQVKQGRVFGKQSGKPYSYLIPGQWQGRFDKLKVIGDSKAGLSTQRLAQNPALFQSLSGIMVGVNVKMIHIIRNPYDIISTMIIRGGRTFEEANERYFANCKALVDIRSRASNSNLFTSKYEELVAQPETRLNDICRFVGVEATNSYLNACISILYNSPVKTRSQIEWSTELIDRVQRKIGEFDFLTGYSYES